MGDSFEHLTHLCPQKGQFSFLIYIHQKDNSVNTLIIYS